MVSPAQAAANVASVTRLEAQRLGFYTGTGSGFQINTLAPSQQIALTNAVAAYILAHPASFDTGAADLTNPVLSAAKAFNTAQTDPGGGLRDYLAAVGDNLAGAGTAVAGIGQGVLTAASWSRWLIPLALVAAVIIWLSNHAGRPPASRA